MKILRYLYSKPKTVRDQYAFMAALLFTSMIAGVWGVTGVVSGRYSLTQAEEQKNEEESSPFFSTLVSQVKKQLAAVGATDEATVVPNDASTTTPTSTSDNAIILTPETIEAVNASSSIVAPVPVEYRVVQITTVSSTASTTSFASSTGQ